MAFTIFLITIPTDIHDRGFLELLQKDDSINVFEVRESVLRGIDDNVSFAITDFLNLNINCIV